MTEIEPFTYEVAGIIYGASVAVPEGGTARIESRADKELLRDVAKPGEYVPTLEPHIIVFDRKWRVVERVKMKQVGVSQPESEPVDDDTGADYDP